MFRMPDSWYDPPEPHECKDEDCDGEDCPNEFTREDYLEQRADEEREERKLGIYRGLD